MDTWNKAIGRITTTGSINEYPVPNLTLFSTSLNADIVVAKDHALWFDDGNGYIGRITTSGNVTEYPTGSSGAGGITNGPDGAIWFQGLGLESVSTNGVFSKYGNLPGGGGGMVLGPDGALWLCDVSNNGILRIQIPSRVGVLSHVAAGGGFTT